MRLREAYEYSLIECNKLKAPSVLLEDFIYLFNKAIQQYVNTVYSRAEYNQQASDDLNFLQTYTTLDATIDPIHQLNDTIWKLKLPKDYLHLLNCIAEFEGNDSGNRCGSGMIRTIASPCNRLTADLYPGILNNYYMKPSHKKPYYYIVNANTSPENITNKEMDDEILEGSYHSVKLGQPNEDNCYRFDSMKEQGDRTSNQSTVNIEIHSRLI